jgi:hypothetical protein
MHQLIKKPLVTLVMPVEPTQGMTKGFVIIRALFLRRKTRNPFPENMNRGMFHSLEELF